MRAEKRMIDQAPFADEYWQLESSGAWVRYRGGSKTGECWRRDSSGKWVLQLGDSNAEHGQAVSTSVTTGSDRHSTSISSSSTAMLRQTGPSSAPPEIFEVDGEDYIQMVMSRDGTKVFPVVIAELAFAPERDWFC